MRYKWLSFTLALIIMIMGCTVSLFAYSEVLTVAQSGTVATDIKKVTKEQERRKQVDANIKVSKLTETDHKVPVGLSTPMIIIRSQPALFQNKKTGSELRSHQPFVVTSSALPSNQSEREKVKTVLPNLFDQPPSPSSVDINGRFIKSANPRDKGDIDGAMIKFDFKQ